MERQVMASRIVQGKEKNKKEDYLPLPSKQVSDESEQIEKSCLTEEEEDGCLSDASDHHNSKKRIREATTTCESKKRKTTLMPGKLDSRYQTTSFLDEWLFGNTHLPKIVNNKAAAIKNDQDMMIMNKLQQIPLSGDFLFPRAQFLPQVKIFALPYTVPF